MADLSSIEKDIIATLDKVFDKYPDIESLPESKVGVKSGMWNQGWRQYRQHFEELGLVDGIRRIQRDMVFDYSFPRAWVESAWLLEEQLDYLKSIGFDMLSAPDDICESFVADPSQVWEVEGRKISNDFLFRFIMTQRVWDTISRPNARVLEIGAGGGNFARVAKQRNPSIKYIIIDLLNTMSVSYSSLRLRYPDAKAVLIDSPEQLADLDLDADFTFIPAEMYQDLDRFHVDLAINSFSLGEMKQSVVNNYMALIQDTLEVDRFYSLNRYLQREARMKPGWADEEYQAAYATPVDNKWKALRWEWCPTFVRQHLYEADTTTTLELYLERAPEQADDSQALRQKSEALFAEAQQWGELRGPSYHRLMWESIRLDPRRENIEPLHAYLKETDTREHRYYGRLLRECGVDVPEPYSKPWELPERKMTLGRVVAGGIRRVARPFLRALDPGSWTG
jgi:hypothetical protein